MEKFFSVFGKFVLVLLVLGGASYAAFYFGRQTAPIPESNTTQVPVETAMPPAKQDLASPDTTIAAGLSASSGLSFTAYTITLPAGWTYVHNQDTSVPTDTLTISKGSYSIKIYQAATGGAMCIYPGDPTFEGPSSVFDNFVALTTSDGINLRRGSIAQNFTLCQKGADGTFQQPTLFGHISYKTPAVAAPTVLSEMDAIIATLKKS